MCGLVFDKKRMPYPAYTIILMLIIYYRRQAMSHVLYYPIKYASVFPRTSRVMKICGPKEQRGK